MSVTIQCNEQFKYLVTPLIGITFFIQQSSKLKIRQQIYSESIAKTSLSAV